MSISFEIPGGTIAPVVEMTHAVQPIREFLPDLGEALLDRHRDWLHPDWVDAQDRVMLCFQSFVVCTRHHTILVDACIGNDKSRSRPSWDRKRDDAWMSALHEVGTAPEAIDFVLCTHLHADHVGWNTRLNSGRFVPTFPNARYLFSAKELDYWTARHAREPIAHFEDSVLPVVAAGQADLVASDHVIDDLVRLLPTPGHTPDHYAVELGRGRSAVITGDLLHSPIQLRHPELQMMLDLDPAQASVTRRTFLEWVCETDTLCCFSHFPALAAGHVRREGGGFRCEPLA